ncbi:MAG: hypothetical protein EOO14_00385 [Chitinophagaceae bacterium]|nr:MAG: hypothetical protein EOO14_00385 [Chitinophagaceae bacterium]
MLLKCPCCTNSYPLNQFLEKDFENQKEKSILRLETICYMVCQADGLKLSQVKEKTRRRPIVQARQKIFYIARTVCRINHSIIAWYFDMDHTTVIHSVQTVNDLLTYDDEMKDAIQRLTNEYTKEFWLEPVKA